MLLTCFELSSQASTRKLFSSLSSDFGTGRSVWGSGRVRWGMHPTPLAYMTAAQNSQATFGGVTWCGVFLFDTWNAQGPGREN